MCKASSTRDIGLDTKVSSGRNCHEKCENGGEIDIGILD